MREKANVTAKQTETKSAVSGAPVRQPEHTPALHSPVERMLRLQRTVGNQAVQRLAQSCPVFPTEAEKDEEQRQTKPLAEQTTPLIQQLK
jgi:hypothetical protein